MKKILLTFTMLFAIISCGEDYHIVNLEIENHIFKPAELHVPAGKKIKLIITNLDPSAEEFESDDLKREKVILGGKKSAIIFGPLEKGQYEFEGEFHPQTAQGKIIAE
jgi:plastocyanin